MKRYLLLTHRWLGILFGGLFLVWFGSGVTMMYVGFPNLTTPERLAGTPPLGQAVPPLPAPAEIAPRLGSSAAPLEARLGRLLDRWVYRVEQETSAGGGAVWRLFDARDGTALPPVDQTAAVAVAQAFYRQAHPAAPPPQAQATGAAFDMDQWTLSGSLASYRPLYKVCFADAAGTVLYVSAPGGEVVRDTTRRERAFNWLGAIPHWIYPYFLRRSNPLWRAVVTFLSAAGTLLALSGLVAAVVRVRWRRRGGGNRLPQRGRRRAHVVTGLLFGLPALTWVFSGLLSMAPGSFWGKWTDARPTAAQQRGWEGAQLDPGRFVLAPDRAFSAVTGARECRLTFFDARPFYLLTDLSGDSSLVSARDGTVEREADPPVLARKAAALLPDSRLLRLERLDAYDAYYYSRRPGEDALPLPVWRASFDDAAHTVFHLDARRGLLLNRQTDGSRLYRWLFNGLHSWDFPVLTRLGWWRDVLVIFALGGGLSLSYLGCRLAVGHLWGKGSSRVAMDTRTVHAPETIEAKHLR